MDLYSRKSLWKVYLAVAGAIIMLISLWHTNFLSKNLAEGERYMAQHYAMAQEQINKNIEESEDEDLTLQLEILQSNKTIPVIVTDEKGDVIYDINFGNRSNDKKYLADLARKMEKNGFKPIYNSSGNKIYYRESRVLQQLKFFPIIQLILIAAFIGLGYVGFSSARRGEQDRVWVGMAKETAHQLGTPISGIVAWLENLRAIKEDDTEVLEIVDELHNDVGRLGLIAERFSKIGSIPELSSVNIYEELEKCRAYMQRRASRKVEFKFPDPLSEPLLVKLNPPLFDWVIENLLRNALDAMDGQGKIEVQIKSDTQHIELEVSDTGKGIPASKHKTVFQPGYTTKKRGWGLGLSLSRRIIEEYHRGKIYVKKSEEGKGTSFGIRLDRA
jgi:two-component sensor histidine kinase